MQFSVFECSSALLQASREGFRRNEGKRRSLSSFFGKRFLAPGKFAEKTIEDHCDWALLVFRN